LSIFLNTSQIIPAQAVRGCCSTHGGVAGCAGTKLKCNDGTLSPTCSCDGLASSDETNRMRRHRRPEEGIDYQLKPGANIENLDSRMDPALNALADIWEDLSDNIPLINHGRDGIHPDKNVSGTDCSSYQACVKTSHSRHYDDLAIDVDTQDLSYEQLGDLKNSLKQNLDLQQFWWKVEDQGTDNEHLHVQFNPATGEKLPPRKL
jgi:hypothetical protein